MLGRDGAEEEGVLGRAGGEDEGVLGREYPPEELGRCASARPGVSAVSIIMAAVAIARNLMVKSFGNPVLHGGEEKGRYRLAFQEEVSKVKPDPV